MSKTNVLLRASTYEAARAEVAKYHNGPFYILGHTNGKLRFASGGTGMKGLEAKTFVGRLYPVEAGS